MPRFFCCPEPFSHDDKFIRIDSKPPRSFLEGLLMSRHIKPLSTPVMGVYGAFSCVLGLCLTAGQCAKIFLLSRIVFTPTTKLDKLSTIYPYQLSHLKKNTRTNSHIYPYQFSHLKSKNNGFMRFFVPLK